jgi:hypothetical protein
VNPVHTTASCFSQIDITAIVQPQW